MSVTERTLIMKHLPSGLANMLRRPIETASKKGPSNR